MAFNGHHPIVQWSYFGLQSAGPISGDRVINYLFWPIQILMWAYEDFFFWAIWPVIVASWTSFWSWWDSLTIE